MTTRIHMLMRNRCLHGKAYTYVHTKTPQLLFLSFLPSCAQNETVLNVLQVPSQLVKDFACIVVAQGKLCEGDMLLLP